MPLFPLQRVLQTIYKEHTFQFANIFHVPFSSLAGVANYIEKLHQNFLWGRIGEELIFYLLSWSKICSPISKGELGVQNLISFNCALLGKSLWRYVHERGVVESCGRL
jgi:hypothetical protein